VASSARIRTSAAAPSVTPPAPRGPGEEGVLLTPRSRNGARSDGEGSVLGEGLDEAIEKWTKDIRKAVIQAPEYDPNWDNMLKAEFNQAYNLAAKTKQRRVPSLGEGA